MRRGGLLVAGILFVSVGICVQAGPARDVLTDLAQAARGERIVSGVVTVSAGVVIGVASAAFLMDTDLGVYGLLAGGAVAIPGVLLLAVPSSVELEAARAGDSEAAAALALERLAEEGKRSRVISGIANAASGAAALFYPIRVLTPYDNVYSALASFGMAAYDFLVPSKEEAAYDRYLALVGQEP